MQWKVSVLFVNQKCLKDKKKLKLEKKIRKNVATKLEEGGGKGLSGRALKKNFLRLP